MVSEHLPHSPVLGPDSPTTTADPAERLLPVPVETPLAEVEDRQYLEIRPSDTPVSPQAAVRALEQVHARLQEEATTGLLATLTRSTDRPLLEWLLVSTGDADPRLRYLVGTTHEALLASLETLCRTAFPRTYEVQAVEWHPRRLLLETGDHPAAAGPDAASPPQARPTAHPAITAETPYVAGVQYAATADRPRDWQTGFTPYSKLVGDDTTGPSRDRSAGSHDESRRIPLATLADIMCDVALPMVYQVVCRPYRDWSGARETYIGDLETGTASLVDELLDALADRSTADRRAYEPPFADRQRIERLQARRPHRSFCVSARAAVLTRSAPDTADQAASRLADALGAVDGPTHRIQGRVVTDDDGRLRWGQPPGTALFEALCARQLDEPGYQRPRNRLPLRTPRSTGLIVDSRELSSLCIVDGAGLTTRGRRAVETRPSERAGLALPPPDQLARYEPPGQLLCMPLTTDRLPSGDPLCLPPAFQPRHSVVAGGTGTGKSVLLATAMLSNITATDGPDILFDYKGGGMARNYLRAHHSVDGPIDEADDVLYFDLTTALPALSVLDIRPLVEAGLSREDAVARKIGHFEQIVAGLLPADRYHEAFEASRAVRNHLQALFDPVHGDDVVGIDDLHTALHRTLTEESLPPVADEALERYFQGLRERDRDVFNRIMGAAVARVEEIATDARVAPLFTAPDADSADAATSGGSPGRPAGTAGSAGGDAATWSGADGDTVGPAAAATEDRTAADQGAAPAAHLDPATLIDSDRVVVIDFGGLEPRAKEALTLALLSELWTALKARAETAPDTESLPLVNLYLDDAKDVVATELMETLFAQGRAFGLALTLGLQFPAQLETADPTDDTYRELLNEVGTWVVGNVGVADSLADVLATDDLRRRTVARRLGHLQRGEWLVRPDGPFDGPTPRPFLAESLPAPRGHPASEAPLTDAEEAAFQRALERVRARSADSYGIRHAARRAGATDTDAAATDTAAAADTDTDADAALDMAAVTADEGERPVVAAAEMMSGDTAAAGRPRTDSLLPHTDRLPTCVDYDRARDAVRCLDCHTRFDATIEGMADAIDCCHSLDGVDRADVPVCSFNLKCSVRELAQSAFTLRQLLFLQAVYNAQQLQYHPLEYDLLTDSMLRLQEYVGIDRDAVDELVEAGLLRHDTDRPHLLYTVTPDGRDAINESYREGVDHGPGEGDLGESTEHTLGVEVARRYLQQAHRDDPDSPVAEVVPYYQTGDNHRLDVAGLGPEGRIHVTVEVERINNDLQRAVLDDYDKMAACDPAEALWVVMSHDEAHDIVGALHDPIEGAPRVDKTYATSTPAQDIRIDAPGLTVVRTLEQLRNAVLEAADDRYRVPR